MRTQYEQLEYEYYETFWQSRNNGFSSNENHYSSAIAFPGVVDFIAWLSDQDRKPRTVLDIGIGNGRNAVVFAQAGYTVTGIDIAPSAIEIAQKNAAENNVTYTARVQSFFSYTPKQAFDVVVDCGLLHHARKQEWRHYQEQLDRVCAPCGYVFLKVFSSASPYLFERTYGARNWTLYEQHYNHFFTDNELELILGDRYTIHEQYYLPKSDSGIVYTVIFAQKKS